MTITTINDLIRFCGSRYVDSFQQGSHSAALSRLASVEGRIRARQQAQQSMTHSRAVQGDARHSPGISISVPGISSSHGHPPSGLPVALPSPQAPSDDPGIPNKKRFLKKTSALAMAEDNLSHSPGAEVSAEIPAGADANVRCLSVGKDRSVGAVKLWTGAARPEPVAAAAGAGHGVNLDSDEEDMRKLLGDSLDSTEDSLFRRRRSPMKTPGKASSEMRVSSPQPPTVGDHHPPWSAPCSPPQRSLSSASTSSWGRGEVRSLAELFPGGPAEEEGLQSGRVSRSSSSISSEEFKINVMSLDDLAPVATAETTGRQEEHKPQNDHQWTPPPTVGEDEERWEEEGEAVDYQSHFESSSVGTERTANDGSSAGSLISEHLGGGSSEDEGKTAKRKKPKEGDVSEVSTCRDGSSWEEGGGDHSDDDRYGSSFSDCSSRASETRSGRSQDSSVRSSTSETLAPRSPRRFGVPRRPGREVATQTQRDPLSYSWSTGMAVLGPAMGMASVDPTPVATHTVGAEALEALTAYSPAVFALNDMLRQQLGLTRQFVQASRRLHHSVVQGLGPADHTYTTLEDTKQFIRKHRPPKLTMEQALEEVLQEMRDYHYI